MTFRGQQFRERCGALVHTKLCSLSCCSHADHKVSQTTSGGGLVHLVIRSQSGMNDICMVFGHADTSGFVCPGFETFGSEISVSTLYNTGEWDYISVVFVSQH